MNKDLYLFSLTIVFTIHEVTDWLKLHKFGKQVNSQVRLIMSCHSVGKNGSAFIPGGFSSCM